ncbi:DUF2059 domain-containing protein [Frigidibacter sp. ROC022]|uniref:DUF2059 domain-containing protein n=1 Tax=Frigidibacter sp. ROC022 TaxID=2971796 RepID=UPI00215A5358|nr:DUF2059 domain-containing protein [Frigidibacter sp. ROC022]MCR8723910.1 DUF2059 domain-containing protein [Frigidibacter sp. ROC022]
MKSLLRSFRVLPPLLSLLVAGLVFFSQSHAHAADRDKLQAFLKVTGYDVVIESLQQGAMAGPGMVGEAPDTFGKQYSKLAEEVFVPEEMVRRAVDILEAVMPEALVDAGADFYASDLGQRLVAVENASHMADDTVKYTEGQKLVQQMIDSHSPRLDLLRELDRAIGSAETSRKAVVEIQVRFLLAAMAAGASPLDMTETELRAELMREAVARAPQSEMLGLMANAWTYRDISDADLAAYVAALETPEMQRVYEVLNATQFQVMIERYQVLGARLGELQPEQEL